MNNKLENKEDQQQEGKKYLFKKGRNKKIKKSTKNNGNSWKQNL